jgi:hypothetical protein
MIYDFGPQQILESRLKQSRAIPFRIRKFWAAQLAERLYGQHTPEEVFENFDGMPRRRQTDDYPPYPYRLLHELCTDREFRRECRRVWHKREEELSEYADNVTLDPLSAGMVWLLSLSLYFAFAIGVFNGLNLPIDPLTAAFILIVLCFGWWLNCVVGAIFSIGSAIVRRTLQRRQALLAIRAGETGAKQ